MVKDAPESKAKKKDPLDEAWEKFEADGGSGRQNVNEMLKAIYEKIRSG